MANTDNLNVSLVEAAQSGKEVTISTAFLVFDALAGVLTVTAATPGTIALTEAESRAAYVVVLGSPGGAVVLQVSGTLGKGTLVCNGIEDGSALTAKVGAGGTESDEIPEAGSLLLWPTGSILVGGGGASIARSSVTVTAAGLASHATANLAATAAVSGFLLGISASHDAWIRGYSTSAARTADAGRLSTDPSPIDAGVLFEYQLSAATALAYDCAPAIPFANMDGTPTDTIYLAVYNATGATHDLDVTLNFLPLETL